MCVFVPFYSRNTHKSSANIMTTECCKVAWFTASVRLRVVLSIQKPIAFAITLQEYNILQNNICKGWIAKYIPKCLMYIFEDW